MSSLLNGLPSLRLIALITVIAACVIQWSGRLPALAWLIPVAVGVLILQLAVRRVRAAVGLAFIALLVTTGLTLQIQRGLGARLPASLEGVDLVVTGVVDAMAQRQDFGDRVSFAVESCHLANPDVTGGCGRLERIQLSWGALPRRPPADAARTTNPPATGMATDTGNGAGNDTGNDTDAEPPTEPARTRQWAEPGQRWRLTVRLRRPVAPVNPDGFDLELRYLQQGIGALGRVLARERLADPAGWGPAALASRALLAIEAWRSQLRDRIEAMHADRAHRPGGAAGEHWSLLGIVTGLSIGDQAAITSVQWGLFSRTGVSHLMAIVNS